MSVQAQVLASPQPPVMPGGAALTQPTSMSINYLTHCRPVQA